MKSTSHTFQDDWSFLQKNTDAILLKKGDSLVAVTPSMQGRVMTSSAAGMEGVSFGWINRELIQSRAPQPQIHVYGGEDRFWLGPEGGQYSIYFKNGASFDFKNWKVPAVIDTEGFTLAEQKEDRAVFTRDFDLENYSGTRFNASVKRSVVLLSREEAGKHLGVSLPTKIKLAAYQTENILKNRGQQDWTPDKGLLSIWILGMYNPSSATTIVIPFKSGSESTLGPKVNDTYFGKVPPERLRVDHDILFFSGDGAMRGKIGISPARAKGVAGSFDDTHDVLTIVQYNQPEQHSGYVNSMWELQKDPYSGDVINSYNDGPPEPGAKPLGPFYELETSSPAARLKAGESLTHIHRTLHLQGPEEELDPIAKKVFGVGIREIKSGLSSR